MPKILVTGGCGYIGSHTIIELIRNTDYEVISIDNYSNSKPQTMERIKLITGREIINYNLDLCSISNLVQVFRENPDLVGVIHFAALKSVPESVQEPIKYYHNNLTSLLNLIDVCQRFGVNNFIFSSSCSVYGDVKSLPVDENTPLSNPNSPYAYTKLMGEEVIKSIKSPINFTILRYFNPVGADQSGLIGEDPSNLPTSLVPIITQTAKGIRDQMWVYGNNYETRDGSCIRDYIHVSDIAQAHLLALDFNQKNSGVEIFNLGSGKGVSVLEAIQAFEQVSGLKINYQIVDRREGDIAAIYSNSSKAKSLLGWEPQLDLDQMMRSAWQWQKVSMKG